MDKNLSTVVYLMLFISCTVPKYISSNHSRDLYKIIKIDSIRGVYILYATKNDSVYKICSVKEQQEAFCDRIIKGHFYHFILKSLIIKEINGQTTTNMMLHIDGMQIADAIITLESKSRRELYKAENIKGLCFLKN
jgi:hypothetical protein